MGGWSGVHLFDSTTKQPSGCKKCSTSPNNFLLFKPMFNLEQCTSIHYQSLSLRNSIKFSTETSQKYQFETPNICHSLVTEKHSIWHHNTLLQLIFRKSPNPKLFLISSNSSSIPFALAQLASLQNISLMIIHSNLVHPFSPFHHPQSVVALWIGIWL